MARWYAVASKPSLAKLYGSLVSGLTVGSNVEEPKPFHTGMSGVIRCVRST